MKISYGITVHNEVEELEKLLGILLVNIDEQDEVVICVDGNDKGVKDVIELYSIDSRVIHYDRKLEKDFAAQKNSVIEKSSGDYIFHIDADEYPNKILIQQLKQILEMNDVDLVWIPRVNTVDGFMDKQVMKYELEKMIHGQAIQMITIMQKYLPAVLDGVATKMRLEADRKYKCKLLEDTTIKDDC